MKQYTTGWQHDKPAFREQEAFLMLDDQQENMIVNLYPEMRFQPILGFGGAFTEAAGSVLEKMPSGAQSEILEAYYGQNGLRYTMARTHIDSCDFSLDNHSAVTDREDTAFASMNLAHEERYILPYLLQAQRIAGMDIRVLLAPWSPPAFMKTNNERNGGGSLKPEYYAAWAKYIALYLSAMQRRGMVPFMVSAQNEPKATQTWDSCVYTAQEESAFVRDYLVPALKAAGLSTGITIWDHNKERLFDRSHSVLRDPATNAAVAGIAFHWYSGDHFEAVALTRQAHPDKLLFFTEGCVEYSRFSGSQLPNAQMYAHDMIGNLNAGMNAFLDWNLV
ncbi:MAG: glucosylceramidase, partial [Clostridia bacterium]|nr:glucosylceramidase [Clostridia bacterium]